MAKNFTITASLRFSWMRWEISVSSGRTLMSSAYDISSTAGETVETMGDQVKQIYHWVEHYLELYTTQIWCLRVLLLSSQTCQSWRSYIVVSLTIKERNSARLQVPRAYQQRFWRRGNQPYYNNMRELFSLFWEKDYVPRHTRDSKIITLQKNKGDRRDCNNYQGIPLLSIAGKAFQTST